MLKAMKEREIQSEDKEQKGKRRTEWSVWVLSSRGERGGVSTGGEGRGEGRASRASGEVKSYSNSEELESARAP